MKWRVMIIIAAVAIITAALTIGFIGQSTTLRSRLIIPIFVIAYLIYRSSYGSRRNITLCIILTGIFLDATSAYPFGIITSALVVATVIPMIVVKNFFSHRTMVSFIIFVMSSFLVYQLMLWGMTAGVSLFIDTQHTLHMTAQHVRIIAEGIFIHGILALIISLVTHTRTRTTEEITGKKYAV